MSILKSRTDLSLLKTAAQVAGSVCDQLMEAAQPGVSSIELEQLANRLLQMNRSTAPFKHFEGFGHAICLSLNEEIVNGPPSRERVLKEGDLVSIAVGSCHKGFHGKAARTRYLGSAPPEPVQRLLEGTQAIFPTFLEASMSTASFDFLLEKGVKLAHSYQLTIIEGAGGAGIGKYLHEEPIIPNHPKDLTESITLMPGFAFTLMPMMSVGEDSRFIIHEDGWTQVTADGALSAHFAETCLMTDHGLVLLSRNS